VPVLLIGMTVALAIVLMGALSQPIHDATESWGPDSAFGHALTYSLVLLPAAWLAFKALLGGGSHKPRPTTAAAR